MKIKLTILPIIMIVIISITSPFAFADANSDLQTVVKGNSAFGFDLYQKLKEKEGNLFFSRAIYSFHPTVFPPHLQ